jgi:hypothetical protein
MSIGDCIPFRYKTTTSGVVGTISELGTCTATEIPVTGIATPNGLAYFIKVDKGLLISDRIVQHSISWNELNNAGYIEGKKNDILNLDMTSETTPSLYSVIDNFHGVTPAGLFQCLHGNHLLMIIVAEAHG